MYSYNQNSIEFVWRFIPILTAAIALVVVYANARAGVRNKQADLIIHFHKQFDELQKKRTDLRVAQAEKIVLKTNTWSEQRLDIEADMFFDRFWSLQFDEFLAWYEGYVPTRLYVYWVFSRWRELHQTVTNSEWEISGRTMSSTLEELKNRWQNSPDKSSGHSVHVTNFLGLMQSLKTEPICINVHKLLRTYGPNYPVRCFRIVFGAY